MKAGEQGPGPESVFLGTHMLKVGGHNATQEAVC